MGRSITAVTARSDCGNHKLDYPQSRNAGIYLLEKYFEVKIYCRKTALFQVNTLLKQLFISRIFLNFVPIKTTSKSLDYGSKSLCDFRPSRNKFSR